MGGKWEQWLSQIRTGDGHPLVRFLLKELARQFERLKLLSLQLKSLEIERAAIVAQEQTVPSGKKIGNREKVSTLVRHADLTICCKLVMNEIHGPGLVDSTLRRFVAQL